MAGKQIDMLMSGVFDSSGNVLTSGTVEFFESGTSTPKTVYADEALGSSLGTSITLDSRGSKLVFDDGLTDLKMVLKDSAGSTIDTYDGLEYIDKANSLATKLSLDGSTTMTGDLEMDTNDINDVTLLDIQAGGNIQFGTAATKIEESGGALGVFTGSTERITVESGGNIGVNTTSPDSSLHIFEGSAGTVTAPANAFLVLENSGDTFMSILTPNTDSAGIVFGDPDDNNVGQLAYDHSDNSFQWTANAAERMRLTAGGSLGLNVTAPDAILHAVNATAGSVTAATNSVIVAENSVDCVINILNPAGQSGILAFGDDSDNDIGKIVYDHSANCMGFFTNAAEKLTINSDGNLGIGDTNADSALEISKDAGGTDGGFITFNELAADATAPATNKAALYAKDNGAGKTQLIARFPTGAVQVLATEP